MGVSNAIVVPFYKKHMIDIKGDIALLGSSNNDMFDGDLYDLSLGNWEINSEWMLPKKYDTIICTRCAYFAQKPYNFIERCHNSLNDNGRLYVDWGIGDHWRFTKFKVGWNKNGEQEYAYSRTNFLWSMVWNDDFLKDKECIRFEKEIEKYGYSSLKDAIYLEVPSILDTYHIDKYFKEVKYNILTIVSPYLQMYVLVSGVKI